MVATSSSYKRPSLLDNIIIFTCSASTSYKEFRKRIQNNQVISQRTEKYKLASGTDLGNNFISRETVRVY